jgi:hypothetical protein
MLWWNPYDLKLGQMKRLDSEMKIKRKKARVKRGKKKMKTEWRGKKRRKTEWRKKKMRAESKGTKKKMRMRKEYTGQGDGGRGKRRGRECNRGSESGSCAGER